MAKKKLSEIDKFLIQEAEHDPESVEAMGGYEKLDSFLTYEGIYGYTDQIIEMVKSIGIKNL